MISSNQQHTLGASFELQGIGLHTGVTSTLLVEPADANTGYVFVRTDLEGAPEIPALVANVHETRRGTTLQSGEAQIYTTEHVLAALYASGVDNARLCIDGPEVPILDGSAQPSRSMASKAVVSIEIPPPVRLATEGAPKQAWCPSMGLTVRQFHRPKSLYVSQNGG